MVLLLAFRVATEKKVKQWIPNLMTVVYGCVLPTPIILSLESHTDAPLAPLPEMMMLFPLEGMGLS